MLLLVAAALLHCDLEAVKESRFRDLHLLREAFDKILVDNAIGRREKGQDMADEVPFVIVELEPVVHIVCKVDLLRSPVRNQM